MVNKVLNLFRLKKYSLIFVLFSSVILLAVCLSALILYYANDVEKLVHNYPYFDQKEGIYKLATKKPKTWVSLKDVSLYARSAIVISEDWAFYQHEGLDFYQIKKVIKESIEEVELVRGASTITQQVIKNTILSNEHSLWRKLREAILAYKIERLLSKDQILEIYLNIVELGRDLYGIKPASYYYFNKHPSELTAREGAFLAMLLPSPVKYSVSFRKKELTEYASQIIHKILIKLRQAKVYTEEDRLLEMKKRFYWEPVIKEEPEENLLESDKALEDYEFLEYEI